MLLLYVSESIDQVLTIREEKTRNRLDSRQNPSPPLRSSSALIFEKEGLSLVPIVAPQKLGLGIVHRSVGAFPNRNKGRQRGLPVTAAPKVEAATRRSSCKPVKALSC